MKVAGLIRRPLVAACFYLSGYLIERIGDLKTIAVSSFLFTVSFLAISFINIPWLVLVVDILQAAGYAFSYSGLNIHFSKPGSKARSAVIFGKKWCIFIKTIDTLHEKQGLEHRFFVRESTPTFDISNCISTLPTQYTTFIIEYAAWTSHLWPISLLYFSKYLKRLVYCQWDQYGYYIYIYIYIYISKSH